MKKIYVGCSLTHASEEFRLAIDDLKRKLRKEHVILEFLGLEKGTAQDVFRHDIANVKECDLFVAECTHPSIGLGIEIGHALQYGKPIVAIAKEGAYVSRMVTGISENTFRFYRYKTTKDVLDIVRIAIENL